MISRHHTRVRLDDQSEAISTLKDPARLERQEKGVAYHAGYCLHFSPPPLLLCTHRAPEHGHLQLGKKQRTALHRDAGMRCLCKDTGYRVSQLRVRKA